jgi:hypothetical protein
MTMMRQPPAFSRRWIALKRIYDGCVFSDVERIEAIPFMHAP